MRFCYSKGRCGIKTSDAKAAKFFLEKIAFEFHEPIEFDFSVERREYDANRVGGRNTCCLRHPHLLLDFNPLEKKDLNMGILGFGLFATEQALQICPQFVEIFSLFPEARFCLFDNDKELLDSLRKQIYIGKFVAYESLMLKLYLTQSQLDKRYRELFLRMQKSLDALNLNTRKEDISLAVKVNPDKIAIREFDFLSSEIDEKTFDLLIATFSLSIALNKVKDVHQHLLVLSKFVRALKEGGTLYVDSFIINIHEKPETNILNLYLECLVGNKLDIKIIKNSDFFSESQADMATFYCYRTETIRFTMTTASIVKITRTSKELSEEYVKIINESYKRYLDYVRNRPESKTDEK